MNKFPPLDLNWLNWATGQMWNSFGSATTNSYWEHRQKRSCFALRPPPPPPMVWIGKNGSLLLPPTSVRDSACELNNGRLDIFLFHQFSLFFLFLLCFQNCFFLFFQPTVVVPLAPPSPSRPSFFSFLFYFFRCCLHGWPQSKSATNCGNTTHVIYENTILKAKNSRNRGVFFQKKRFLDIFYLGFPSWHIQYTMWQSRLRPFWWGWWGADCRQRGEKRSTRWVRCQVMS